MTASHHRRVTAPGDGRSRSPRPAARRDEELARHLSLDPTLVVALIDDLEERGLCERGRHPEDRRRHMIQLTAKGRKVYREAHALAAQVGDEIFAPLDRSERARLTEMLKRIMDPLWGKPGEGACPPIATFPWSASPRSANDARLSNPTA